MSARVWNPHREQTSRVEPWTRPTHEVSSASHQTAPEPEQSRNFANCLFIYCKLKKLKWNQTLKHASVCPQTLGHQRDDISFITNDLKTKFTSCLLQFGCLLLLILWIVTVTAQQFPLLQENCHYCCHFGVLWHHSWSTNQTSIPDGDLDWCRTPEQTAALLLELVSGDYGNISAPRFCWVQPMIRSPPSELLSAELWIGVGQDMGQQGRGRVMMGGVASVHVQVQCGRGRRVQVVWGQEHPSGFSQELQTHSWLTLPLGPDRGDVTWQHKQ